MAFGTRPKPKVQHKKRRAQHHRHSRPYLRTYWPYLPMIGIMSVGLILNALWSSGAVLGGNSDFSSQTLLSETNEQRDALNQTPLIIDQRLTDAAQAKADSMSKYNYWSHTSPSGQKPWSFVANAGYPYQSVGENLAYGFNNASEVIGGWMNSPEHKANVLNGAYRHVGFGIASSPNYQGKGAQTIVVAEYGQPAGATLGAKVPSAASDVGSQVSRVEVLTGGQAPWSLAAVSALTGAAITLFIIRHGFRIRRLLNEGEAFIVHHPMIDIGIVLVVTLGILLTRTNGLIR